MADHCRKQIRDALVAGLGAMVSIISIHAGRSIPFEGPDVPALAIFTNDESVEDHNKAGDQTRVLTVAVEGHVQGTAVVDTLDAIAAEAEPLVFASMPAWVKDVDLITTSIELSGDAVQPAGMIRLEFEARYHVNRTAPDTPL
jgi:hypothetical protein